MKLEHVKKMAEDSRERLSQHQMDMDEWNTGFQHLENAQTLSRALDADIQESMGEMRRRFEVSRDALSEQRESIEQQRAEIRRAATAAIQKLEPIAAKLDNLITDSRYSEHLKGAKRACLDAIRAYRDILAQIDSEPMEEGGSIEAAWKNLSDVSAAFTVAKTITGSVDILMKMKPAQVNAVRSYTGETGSCYKTVNPILRGTKPLSEASEEDIELVRNLHEFLNSNVTSFPMTVWRGVRSDVELVNGGLPLDRFTDEQLVGRLLVDGAFVSTSTEEYACFPHPTKLVLNLPAGTHGAYVANISSAGEYEKEFLLDKNQAFRVTAVQRRDGVRYIYADSLRR